MEIKCSYSYRELTPYEACIESKCKQHLYLNENNSVRLHQDSARYSQIQGQMGVCGVKWCDVVFYTV